MFKGKKTVSSILAAFTATINDLDAVEKASHAESQDKYSKAQDLIDESHNASAESVRAREVADKLRSLVGLNSSPAE